MGWQAARSLDVSVKGKRQRYAAAQHCSMAIALQQSEEQHRKSRAVVLVAPIDPHFTADLFDKRPDNSHSESFAAGWIKSLRQSRAFIGDRQQVAFFRSGFQAESDPAGTVFGCVREQF